MGLLGLPKEVFTNLKQSVVPSPSQPAAEPAVEVAVQQLLHDIPELKIDPGEKIEEPPITAAARETLRQAQELLRPAPSTSLAKS